MYVDYARMISFIRQRMFGALRQHLDWEGPIDFVKLRVSDNNNSADAAGFHRDLIYQGKEHEFTPPFFTCLTYFDHTVLEVIPGSHNIPGYKLMDLPSLYASKQKIAINPGDILLFYSSLLHRGIFTEKLPHRRLIQVFEVFNDTDVLYKIVPKILHVPGDEKYSNMIIQASKNNGLLIDTYNLCVFINAAMGYGRRYNTLEQCGLTSYTYFSSEGLRGRLVISDGTWQPINKYILNHDIPVTLTDLPPQCYSIYRYNVFKRTCINILLTMISLVITFITIITISIVYIHHIYKEKPRLRKR